MPDWAGNTSPMELRSTVVDVMKKLGLGLLSVVLFVGGLGSAAAAGPASRPADVRVLPSATPEERVNTARTVAQAMAELINAYRVANGLHPLVSSERMNADAERWSQQMATTGKLEHSNPDQWDRSGENILYRAYYQQDSMSEEELWQAATAMFQQWKDSDPHNRGMLTARYQGMGLGVHYDASTGYYWATTMFFNDEVWLADQRNYYEMDQTLVQDLGTSRLYVPGGASELLGHTERDYAPANQRDARPRGDSYADYATSRDALDLTDDYRNGMDPRIVEPEDTTPVSFTASHAGSRQVGIDSYAWGQAPSDSTRAWTEVHIAGFGWARSQERPLSSTGRFVIPLSYGINESGTYTYRVAAQTPAGTVYSQHFAFKRTGLVPGNADRKPVGQTTFAWATVPTAANHSAWTQVLIDGRWVTSQRGPVNSRGFVALPLTYGVTARGTQTYRMQFSTTSGVLTSEPFTLTRY